MQFKTRFSLLLQYLAPQHALSRFAGWVANCQWKWLKNHIISDFIRRYRVDMSIAQHADIDHYLSFNDFFTRKLKPGARPIQHDATAIISPADGSISQCGKIHQGILLQAKQHYYDLKNLLGGSQEMATQFIEGNFATIYLAPKDYHRVHMPIRGTLKETIYVPGQLFSVNTQTTEQVPHLFTRNERLICLFETELGPVAIIMVGAMLVSGIKTTWPSNLPSKTLMKETYQQGVTLEKGDELGYFHMGSTVILLFPEKKIAWAPELTEGSNVQMGTSIGTTLR